MTTDHQDLTPTGALVAATAGALRDFFTALRPAAETAARSIAELTQALQQATDAMQAAPVRRDRPPWATPYGPPPHRRRP